MSADHLVSIITIIILVLLYPFVLLRQMAQKIGSLLSYIGRFWLRRKMPPQEYNSDESEPD